MLGRVEDTRLLRGTEHYTDDSTFLNMLYGAVLRRPHAAARIRSVDPAAAAAVAGIVAVYTAQDLAADDIRLMPCTAELRNRDGTRRRNPPHSVFADGIVRHVDNTIGLSGFKHPGMGCAPQHCRQLGGEAARCSRIIASQRRRRVAERSG